MADISYVFKGRSGNGRAVVEITFPDDVASTLNLTNPDTWEIELPLDSKESFEETLVREVDTFLAETSGKKEPDVVISPDIPMEKSTSVSSAVIAARTPR